MITDTTTDMHTKIMIKGILITDILIMEATIRATQISIQTQLIREGSSSPIHNIISNASNNSNKAIHLETLAWEAGHLQAGVAGEVILRKVECQQVLVLDGTLGQVLWAEVTFGLPSIATALTLAVSASNQQAEAFA